MTTGVTIPNTNADINKSIDNSANANIDTNTNTNTNIPVYQYRYQYIVNQS